MTETLSRGFNFEIVKRGPVLELAVVSRPDTTLADGASAAEDMFSLLPRLIGEQGNIEGVVWDLADAPLAGPRTRQAMGVGLEMIAAHDVRMIVIVTHPTMKMLFRRLLGTHLPGRSAIGTERSASRAWIDGLATERGAVEAIDGSWAVAPLAE